MIEAVHGQYYWVRDKFNFMSIARYGDSFHYGNPGWYIVGSEVPYCFEHIGALSAALPPPDAGCSDYPHS